jgi:hypothetical protein
MYSLISASLCRQPWTPIINVSLPVRAGEKFSHIRGKQLFALSHWEREPAPEMQGDLKKGPSI